MATIAHVGTGLLGAAMAERSLARGDTVVVWNRTASKAKALEAKGARLAASAAEAVKGAERVHLALSDDAAVDPLLPELTRAMAPTAWLFDHTTTSVVGTRARYARLENQGFTRFVHAPVFMTPAMAREAKGYILVSGARDRCDGVRPLLAPLTGEVWYAGERPEDAAAYKVFGNAMTLVISGGVADLFAMARGMGLEPKDAVGVFDKMIPGVAGRATRMLKGEFTPPSFELGMARKDLRLALEPALASGLPLAVLPSLARRFDDVLAAGHANEDYSVIAAEALAPPRAPREDEADPFAQLERCHRRLEERLGALAGAPGDPEEEERFFAFLDRSIRRHEDDEEESLFPRLQGHAELAPVIASLRDEHRLQAERQQRLRAATGDADKARLLGELAAGYRAHIEKEERTLFPAAKRALDAEATRALGREMDARRGGGGGGGRGRRGRDEAERGGGGGGGGGGGRNR